MRIVMMGTGPFAVPTFRALLASSHELLCLITRPVPPPTGRSRAAAVSNPMRDVAQEVGLVVEDPASINAPEAIDRLRAWHADLLVVCDYGQILSREALATARLGGINLHASLLPKYRGAAPIHWALYHGEPETGVTVIHMTARLDGGPCLVQRAVQVPLDENAVQLEQRLSHLGVAAVLEAIELLAPWDGVSLLGNVQAAQAVSKAPRLQKSDGQIAWNRSARQICDQVRAFKPWPGSFTDWPRPKGPLRLLLDQVHVASPTTADVPSGTVLKAEGGELIVGCGAGQLAIDRLQPAGKNVVTAAEFLRGYPIHAGDRLTGEPSPGS